MVNFDPDCKLCPRLSSHLAQIRQDYPSYHARPVAPFGVSKPKLLIVGLAPGMHGANATGRPFTGDHAGIMLYALPDRRLEPCCFVHDHPVQALTEQRDWVVGGLAADL